jgi:drug/metabolite transporter (DMT)-like permease
MADPIQLRMGARQWGILLLLSILWGGSFFFIEVAVTQIPPFTLVLLRVTLAAGALLLFLAVRGELRLDRALIGPFFVMALLNNALPFSLLASGQTVIGSGLASILNATTPIWTVIIAHLFTRDERMSPLKVTGVLLGFGGVAVMIGADLLGQIGESLWAQLACVAAGLCYALAGVYGRRFSRLGVSPITVSAGQLTAASLLLLPVALLVDRPWAMAMPSLGAWACLVALALLSTTFAYVLYFRLIASAGATNAVLVTFLVPVTAILLGVLILGEVLALRHLIGMALIGAGLAAIDGRLLRRRAPATAGADAVRR